MSSSDNELPPLLQSGSSPARGRSRASSKRSRDSDNSSDSAFFSSDDLAEASVDRYKRDARKKQYTKRSWYEPEDRKRLHTYHEMRSATRKPMDSGVYMNSDSSNSSAEDGFALDTLKPRIPSKLATKKMNAFVKPKLPARVSDDEITERAISECLEENLESLDLSRKGLTLLSADIFEPLKLLVKTPRYATTAYAEQITQPLVPDLQVYLSANALERIPGSLLALDTLRVLSLRQNRLVEIPPIIGHLTRLVELNIAANQLKWLPWELLSLLKGKTIAGFHARPNPFIRPSMLVNAEGQLNDSSYATSEAEPHVLPLHIGSSAVSFFQLCGTSHPSSPPVPSTMSSESLALDSDPTAALRRHSYGNGPSLFELSLRICARSSNITEFGGFVGSDAPEMVMKGFQHAEQSRHDYGHPCSVCKQEYVIARAEWVEFWQLQPGSVNERSDAIYPFLRRTCSWACAAAAFA